MAGAPKGRPKPEGSGRKKGTLNKSSWDARAIAEELGINPMEFLLKFAAGDWKGLGYDNECFFVEKPDGAVKMGFVVTPDLRVKASAEAAKYLFPTKKAIEVSNSPDGDGFKIIVEDYSSKDKK